MTTSTMAMGDDDDNNDNDDGITGDEFDNVSTMNGNNDGNRRQ